jgi:DNA replication protein DnaC
VCGPSGTGKTFLLEALGQHAVETGLHVAWFTLESLGVLVRRHRADDTVSKAITRILRADIVAVDDIGLLPVGADAAEGLYRLADAAYEKRSIAISSNLHPAGFDELMPKTLNPRAFGSCTTPTSAKPAVTASGYPRQWPARG